MQRQSLDLGALRELERDYVMSTYARLPIVVARGEGMRLWDTDGNEYLDFFSGIGVCNIGHCHPEVVEAVRDQVGRLIHSSNLTYTEPAVRLAQRLSERSLGGKVFFCNSGAEASECAIKLVRKKAFSERGAGHAGAGRIVVAEGAFHGRTMGALSATPQREKQLPFAPLLDGIIAVKRNDERALEDACGEDTIAIWVEPIQGESGVHVLSDGFLKKARELCEGYGALLVFDEVQCGLGRTGTLWAYEQLPVIPDLMMLAKSLASGLPIGAVVTNPENANVFEPAEHGSTFGGGPVTAAAALATLDLLDDDRLLERVRLLGKELGDGLAELFKDDKVADVRGRGLMWGIDLPEGRSAPDLVREGLNAGLLLNSTSERTLRLLPPLTIDEGDIQRVLSFLRESL